MREDIEHLRETARGYRERTKASFCSRHSLTICKRPPSRMSVDPEAMIAACALRAGHTSRMTGRTDFADALYRLIVFGSWKSLSTFYVAEARTGLVLLEEKATELTSKNTDATPLSPLD